MHKNTALSIFRIFTNCMHYVRLTLGVFPYRLTDTQFKIDTLDKDPFALDSLARPLPFRGQHKYINQAHIMKLAVYPAANELRPVPQICETLRSLNCP